MARESFGKTWWGKEWLNALTSIDYDNRIPRGATYARRGAVTEINVDGGNISARVQGTRRTPYKISITVPSLKNEQVGLLLDALAEQPLLVSRLLNNELDPKVMDIARSLNIKLFPSSWRDLSMSCSCPDWAVPCKHLAAVIYMLSREIDNNPFLVFQMRGVDLVSELKKRGLSTSTNSMENVPRCCDLYDLSEGRKNEALSNADVVDMTVLADITKPLIGLLPERPTFYQYGDFKASYSRLMTGVVKEAARYLKMLPIVVKSGKTSIGKSDDLQLLLDDDLEVDNLDFDALMREVDNIDSDDISEYAPSVQALHTASRIALHLLACGAVVPRIVRCNQKKYKIVWMPAVTNEAVADVVGQLERMMPDTLLQWQQARLKRPSMLANRSELLLSMLFRILVPHFSPRTDNEIQFFFFNNHKCSFDKVGETAIPGSIAAWLNHIGTSGSKNGLQVVVTVTKNLQFQVGLMASVDGVPTSFEELLSNPQYAAYRIPILQDAALLSPFLTQVDFYISHSARQPMNYTPAEFAKVLFSALPSVRLLGISVAMPKELKDLCRPRATFTLGTKPARDGVGKLSLAEMLDFNWQVAIGDDVLSVDEFRRLTERARGLVYFKGRFFYVDESDLRRLDEALAGERALTPGERLQAALSESYQGSPVRFSPEVRKMMEQVQKIKRIAVPKEIKATLRPYQKRGYEWMYRNAQIGFGSILADDMGLGKTLQVITLLQKFRNDGCGPALVVVPTTLLTNWQSELSRFAPSLTCQPYHGTQRSLRKFGSDILLTTYGTLRSDVVKLRRIKWHTIVIDEAQNIKNANTAQTRAIHSLEAQCRIAMSGTPVENRMSEYWSIMHFANSELLGTAKEFGEAYAIPIQRDGDKAVAERFRRVTAPFMMRRLKTDSSIITDLPDKIEQDTYTFLTDQQAALYQQTVQSALDTIDQAPTDTPQQLFKRQGLVLQMILSLKQVCNHPALFLKNGSTDASLSGKTQTLLTLLEGIVRNRQKVLIFTQFREMGEMLASIIRQNLGEQPLFLHGGLSVKKRASLVNDFQQRPECRIFILSIKAAGTGLNLTAASHVIHFDLWWNPAVEAQATDRAYRIGQHQNVIVHRFITQGTFEEQINRMLQDKKRLADMTVAVGENWIGNLSSTELHSIFDA